MVYFFLHARYTIYRNRTHMNNYIFYEKSSEATFCAYTQVSIVVYAIYQ